jgi:hypothetical protein
MPSVPAVQQESFSHCLPSIETALCCVPAPHTSCWLPPDSATPLSWTSATSLGLTFQCWCPSTAHTHLKRWSTITRDRAYATSMTDCLEQCATMSTVQQCSNNAARCQLHSSALGSHHCDLSSWLYNPCVCRVGNTIHHQ